MKYKHIGKIKQVLYLTHLLSVPIFNGTYCKSRLLISVHSINENKLEKKMNKITGWH